mmetsp:Transcript_59853/g.160241  ORF Transcript_59853/g.160241 Transcript_59853/m.160241 type:complete len:397 (-) Transcript_59853:66-1256(-)
MRVALIAPICVMAAEPSTGVVLTESKSKVSAKDRMRGSARAGAEIRKSVNGLEDEFNQIKAALMSGKETPEVLGAVGKLANMITLRIEPAIKNGHDQDKILLQAIVSQAEDCDSMEKSTKHDCMDLKDSAEKDHDAFTDCNSNKTSKVAELNDKNATCTRDLESAAESKSRWCGKQAEYPAHIRSNFSSCGIECDFSRYTAAECFKGAVDMVAGLKDHFARQKQMYEANSELCKSAERRYTELQHQCNRHATELKSMDSMCDWHHSEACLEWSSYVNCVTKTLCAAYKSCRDDKDAEYDQAMGQVTELVKDRKNEWTSTQTIKCALMTYKRNKSLEESDLDACGRNIDTEWLDLHKVDMPPRLTCDERATMPEYCSASFVSQISNAAAQAKKHVEG